MQFYPLHIIIVLQGLVGIMYKHKCQKLVIDPSFWFHFTNKKIQTYKLSEEPIDIYARLDYNPHKNVAPAILVTTDAFSLLAGDNIKKGQLKNFNIKQDLCAKNLKDAMLQLKRTLWNNLDTWDALLKSPDFMIFSFAEMKRYQYEYHVLFPCLSPKIPFKATPCPPIKAAEELLLLPEVNYFAINLKAPASVMQMESLEGTEGAEDIVICFRELLANNYSWTLRNILCFILRKFPGKTLNFMAIRATKREFFTIQFNQDPSIDSFDIFGWDSDDQGKVVLHFAALESILNPKQLATSSVTLNLQLMKWRLAPELNLDIVKDQRCLIIGAGTLGCNVARCLVAWGVTDITFIDNGVVSYSNPVRQTLFTQEDVGSPKAVAAAKALQKIVPSVNAQGIQMEIPMPGHFVSDKETLKIVVEQFEKLVVEHDVLFLLTDSRESRWLPTVLAKMLSKIAITTALGFDEYVVLRHGPLRSKLGCYFCADLTQPTDSTSHRSLDQQCTIARPGLSMVASSQAVELLVSILQHPERECAAGDTSQNTYFRSSHWGITPHQIRGQMSHFRQQVFVGHGNPNCVACSEPVLQAIQQDAVEFVLNVCNRSNFLQDVSGASQLIEQLENVELCDVD